MCLVSHALFEAKTYDLCEKAGQAKMLCHASHALLGDKTYDLCERTGQAKMLCHASHALFEAKTYAREQDKLKCFAMRVMLSLRSRLMRENGRR